MGAGKNESYSTFLIDGAGSKIIKNLSIVEESKKNKILNITVNTLKNICKKYIPEKPVIHFCKIDVEGGEKDVLLGYDFENYRPKVFCIESTKPETSIPCHEQWEDILLKNDYSFAYQYSINRFYIDNRNPDLKGKIYLIEKSIRYFIQKKNKKM